MRRFNTIIESANPPGRNQLWIDHKKLRYFAEDRWQLLGGGEEQELAILKLPSAVATLTSSSTVEQVKNAFGGDSGITLILNSITSGKKYVAGVSNTVVDGITANAVLPVIATGIQGSNRNLVLSHPMNYYTINLALANGVVSIYVNPTYNASMSDDPLNAVQCGVVKQYIDSMSGGGTGGSEVYHVDVSKLDFTQVADGVSATRNQIDEVGNCIVYWSQGKTVIYNNPNANLSVGDYVGTLNIGFNPSTMVASFIMPFSQDGGDGAFLYMLDTQAATWTVQMLDGGGGGSSNIKVLTTPDLFILKRNKTIYLNASDCAVINSLTHNNYKNIQLYYIGTPAGDDGIFPVNIAGNSLNGTLAEGDSVYLSITTETGTPVFETINVNSTTSMNTSPTGQVNLQVTFDSNSLSQNGYVKFHNGLMLQWGTKTGATNGAISLYFPNSFSNTDYNIYFTGAVNDTSESFIYAPGYDLNGKYTSYCRVLTRGINSTPAIVWTSWDFTWFAIGRWK